MGRFFGFAQDDAGQSPASAAAAANTAANARGGGGAEASLGGSVSGRTSSEMGGGGIGPRADSAAMSAFSGLPALGSTAGGDGPKREESGEGGQGVAADAAAAATATAAATAAAAAQQEALLRGRSLSPEEAQAYSDNVDRTLEVRGCVCFLMVVSELGWLCCGRCGGGGWGGDGGSFVVVGAARCVALVLVVEKS